MSPKGLELLPDQGVSSARSRRSGFSSIAVIDFARHPEAVIQSAPSI